MRKVKKGQGFRHLGTPSSFAHPPKKLSRRRWLGGCAVGMMTLGLAPTKSTPDLFWSHWRGPHLDGQGAGLSVPLVWGPTHGQPWKLPLSGRGISSPVLSSQGLFFTAELEQQAVLVCVDPATGKPRWQVPLADQLPWPKRLNPYWPWFQPTWAAPACCVQGETVVAVYGTRLSVHRGDGRRAWFRHLLESSQHLLPTAGSPLVWKDRIVTTCWQQTPQGLEVLVGAYDLHSGQEHWARRLPVPGASARELCHGSVVAGPSSWGDVVVVPGPQGVWLLEWKTGQLLAQARWGAPQPLGASPLWSQQMLVVMRGEDGPLWGGELRVARRGVQVRWLWRREVGRKVVSTPALWRDLLFVISQAGFARCLHLPTGKIFWRRKLPGTFLASPITAQGRVYFLSQQGKCFVLAASRTFQLLTVNRLPDQFVASAAVGLGRLFLRAQEHLYCVGRFLDQNH